MPNRSMSISLLLITALLVAVGPISGFVAPITSTRRISPLFAAKQVEFEFQGHKAYSEVHPAVSKNKNTDVILIHGFGCSTLYWRATIDTLTKAGYTVHALDLLGQGQSAKPGRADGIEYSIRLWAQQVDDYAQANIGRNRGIVLMGNSLGSVVALTAAAGDYDAPSSIPQRVKGVGMYNCGVGMNSRNVLLELDGIQKVVFTALFDVLDAVVFGNLPLLTYVLDQVVTKELLQNALTGLYKYGEDRVDEALVDSFYYPAKDAGSPDCLSQIYVNDPGATPMQIYDDYSKLQELPVHLVWGTEDPVTPIAGSVGVFFRELANDPESKVSLDTLVAGHVPFDEVPECNDLMLKWLQSVEGTSAKTQSSTIFGDFKLPFGY